MTCILKYVEVPYCVTKLHKLKNFKGPKVQVRNNHQFIEGKKYIFLLETMQTLRSLLPLQQSQIR